MNIADYLFLAFIVATPIVSTIVIKDWQAKRRARFEALEREHNELAEIVKQRRPH